MTEAQEAGINRRPKADLGAAPAKGKTAGRGTQPVIEVEPGSWRINPEHHFHLTLYGIKRPVAEQIRKVLRKSIESFDYSKLISLIALNNVRCKEIDDYISEYRESYTRKIEELKTGSREWKEAGELDREDLLSGFREEAIETIPVRPDVDLETLFEGEPPDRTLDDRLITSFGLEAMGTYLKYAHKLSKVHVIPASAPRRKRFESLVELGLARRGKDIPTIDVALTLKLKDLRDMVSDLDAPKFSRKADAAEFVAASPDAR